MLAPRPIDVRPIDVRPPMSEVAAGWARADEPYRSASAGPGRVRFAESRSRSGLLLTAPHATRHFRHGATKVPDLFTGGLCDVLGARTGAATLSQWGPAVPWDDWSERRDEFRTVLDRVVRPGILVVDLHGMSDRHGVDLCVGLGPAPSPRVRAAAEVLRRIPGYDTRVDSPFTARADYTVTAYVQDVLGGEALQLEIAARHRNPIEQPRQAARLVLALTTAMAELDRPLFPAGDLARGPAVRPAGRRAVRRPPRAAGGPRSRS